MLGCYFHTCILAFSARNIDERKYSWVKSGRDTIPLMVKHSPKHHLHPKHHTPQKKTFFDFVIYFFALTTPMFEIPQAWLIYANQDAANVSTPTWIYFSVASAVFLTYAVKNRIRPLMLAYSLYLVIEIIIVAGIIRYS